MGLEKRVVPVVSLEQLANGRGWFFTGNGHDTVPRRQARHPRDHRL